MKPYIQDTEFTEAEYQLLLRAVTIPECWKPQLRDEAASIIREKLTARTQQQSLSSEAEL